MTRAADPYNRTSNVGAEGAPAREARREPNSEAVRRSPRAPCAARRLTRVEATEARGQPKALAEAGSRRVRHDPNVRPLHSDSVHKLERLLPCRGAFCSRDPFCVMATATPTSAEQFGPFRNPRSPALQQRSLLQ